MGKNPKYTVNYALIRIMSKVIQQITSLVTCIDVVAPAYPTMRRLLAEIHPCQEDTNHVTWRQNREERELSRTRKWAWEAGMRSSLRNRRAEHGVLPPGRKSGALSLFNYQPALTCFRGNLAVTVRTV